MKNIDYLFNELDKLHQKSSTLKEVDFRLTIHGDNFDQSIFHILEKIVEVFNEFTRNQFNDDLILLVNGENLDLNKNNDYISQYIGMDWRFILAKNNLAEILKARDSEKTILFYDKSSMVEWISSIDSCSPEDFFSGSVTIRIRGEFARFGSSHLWILPIGENTPNIQSDELPSDESIQSLIHIMALNKSVRISPRTFALTWGNLEHDLAKPFLKLGILTLCSCLVQEIKCEEDNYKTTLRGIKRLELNLSNNLENYNVSLLNKLILTVKWVYEERSETRLKLIMDRLSMDIEPTNSLVQGMDLFLEEALQQAKDSYAFVILERKDAYHKEMRDILKDMKSQADMYAAKVRDLVSSLTRDILGILVFIALSFIGKFDQNKLNTLLNSAELIVFLKFLSGYLALSCILQLMTHFRDANLSYDESKQWLSILQNYTSKNDNKEKFIEPISKRRMTLFISMFICGLIYVLLSITIWNLPVIIKNLIN